MKVLIYSAFAGGHYIEYLYHIHNSILENDGNDYIFVVPQNFEERAVSLKWGKKRNISFCFFEDKLYTLFQSARLLSKLIRKYNADEVFCISLIRILPFILFLYRGKAKISGIIYTIYLYDWKNSSFIKKLLNVLKYLLFSKFSLFKNVYILNSPPAARKLCQLYNTKKFKSIADPVFIRDLSKCSNLTRQSLSIPDGCTIFLHFGAMYRRKGTLEILDAISMMSFDELKKNYFIFAGKVAPQIKSVFYEKFNALIKKGAQIKLYDEYVEYQLILDLVQISDAILTPYSNITNSSGCFAYGANFRTPLISTNAGMLAKLLKRYKLGIPLQSTDANGIYEALRIFTSYTLKPEDCARYLEENSIERFSKTVLDSFKKI